MEPDSLEEQFRNLNLGIKLQFVINHGTLVCEIKYYGFLVELYILNGHYIEMFYNIHTREVEEIEILKPTERRLGLYAEHVDISSAF